MRDRNAGMNPSWQRNITLVLFAALATVYGLRRYHSSREELRTSTEMMRFVVTNDVIHFYGDRGHIIETNAEWARGLSDVSGEMAFVTFNEIWAKGRRVKWRVEGITKPVVR